MRGAAALIDLRGDIGVAEHRQPVVRCAGRPILELFQGADDPPCSLRRAGAGMGIGAMGTRSAHRHRDPTRALLTEATAFRGRRLTRPQAIDHHQVAVMLEEVARTPRPEGFLVGDGGPAQAAPQFLAQRVQMQEGHGKGGQAALHITGGTVMDAAVDDLAAPGLRDHS
jgi:hypothetical protein